MKPLPWLSACVIAGSLAGGPAWAQPAASPPASPASAPIPTAGTVSLRAALEAAWQRAVVAREREGQRRRAEVDRAVASSLWAAPPSLAMSHRDDRLQGNAGRRETEIGVAVPLWLLGQRAARAGTAEAAATQALAAEQVARLRLAGDLREAAWQLAALQAEMAQAEAQAQALKQLADDVDRRVRAGDLARADALAAQAEALAASALKTDVQQRLQAARSRWTLLTGLTAAPDLKADLATEAPAAAHPELQFASQSTELARQRVELMRRSRRDAPELTIGVRQDTPGRAESSQGSLVVGLRLPFGTDDRNRPLEAAALTELDVAQTQERRLRERLDSDIAAAREAQRSAQAQLEAETARARLLRERTTLIDKSFRAGETPLPDLLRALAAASQADSAAARQTAALGLARARLQQALGLLP
ncbi:MAG: TolC family protein [Burkholderiales bacterium]|nr:TolC family protein [Burkholderiales bacterium]